MSKKKDPNDPAKTMILYWFIHHESILEPVTYEVEERISNIKHDKPWHQRKSRLEAMKPVLRPDLLPKPVLRAMKRAWKAGRYSSPQLAQHYLDRSPEMLAKVRRRLFKEYPKCPCSHQHERKSILVFTEAARQRARVTNRKLFGK